MGSSPSSSLLTTTADFSRIFHRPSSPGTSEWCPGFQVPLGRWPTSPQSPWQRRPVINPAQVRRGKKVQKSSQVSSHAFRKNNKDQRERSKFQRALEIQTKAGKWIDRFGKIEKNSIFTIRNRLFSLNTKPAP